MAKLNWLDKVKADAERITLKRIRDYKEENGITESTEKAEVVAKPAEESTGDNYTETTTKTGRVQYRKNGKIISKADYELNS